MKTTHFLAIASSLSLILAATSTAQENPVTQPAPPPVSIFAKGTGTVSADSAVVSLSHSAEASKLTEAIKKSLTAKENLRKKLTTAGIATKDIVFQNFSSSSERGRLLGKVKHHTVISPIKITVKNEAQFAKIAILVDADDDLTYLGRNANVTDAASLQVKAAADAVKNLKRKIALYEESFEVKLKLISFGEVSQKQVEQGSSPLALAPATYAGRSRKLSVAADAFEYDGSITQSFGDQKTVVHVQGLYRIVED